LSKEQSLLIFDENKKVIYRSEHLPYVSDHFKPYSISS
jgi:hypothetical protein